MEKTELVMVNLDCDKKNRFYNIIGWTEDKIQEVISRYPKDKWLALRR